MIIRVCGQSQIPNNSKFNHRENIPILYDFHDLGQKNFIRDLMMFFSPLTYTYVGHYGKDLLF